MSKLAEMYMMTGEGDQNNLDYVTRERMRMESRTESSLLIFIGLILFVLGMIVGSTLHDNLFHLTEVVK